MIICQICNTEIVGGAYYEKVIGWVTAKDGKRGSSLHKASESLGYAHKVCLEVGNRETQAGLFG